MFGKMAALKNIIWAVGIVVCLGALAVGLIFASAVRYDGSGQVQELSSPDQSEEPLVTVPGSGTLLTLEETEDGGQAYIDSLTFLCDSALIGLRDYGLLSAGMATTQVWGSSAGNIPAADIAQCVIKYPADGTEVPAATAAMAAKPRILVISLGCDSLAETNREDFIANYSSLISSLRSASPDTKLVCCSITSVTTGYTGSDGLTAELVSSANDWLREVCTNNGVWYADVASAVSDSSGTLFMDYASSNGKTLNSAGISAILTYLRSHTV